MATDLKTLYERDFYAWSRHQARELRRLKALRPNTDLDLDYLALEIRDLGSEQLFAIQRQTVRLIEHQQDETAKEPSRRSLSAAPSWASVATAISAFALSRASRSRGFS